jgi:hypothetical protein
MKTSTTASFNKGISKLPSISAPTCRTIEKSSKRAAQAIWASMMLFTTAIVVYSLLYGTPSLISNLVSPVYNFANSYTPTTSIPIYGIIILSTYFTVFAGLGYYSFR